MPKEALFNLPVVLFAAAIVLMRLIVWISRRRKKA
jgi:hypothetical protein